MQAHGRCHLQNDEPQNRDDIKDAEDTSPKILGLHDRHPSPELIENITIECQNDSKSSKDHARAPALSPQTVAFPADIIGVDKIEVVEEHTPHAAPSTSFGVDVHELTRILAGFVGFLKKALKDTNEEAGSPRTQHSRSRPRTPDSSLQGPRLDQPSFIVSSNVDKHEKPYPRKGSTRMPKRLVSTKVLIDLDYPYYFYDEETVLIELALGNEQIDEIIGLSREDQLSAPTVAEEVENFVGELHQDDAATPGPESQLDEARGRSGETPPIRFSALIFDNGDRVGQRDPLRLRQDGPFSTIQHSPEETYKPDKEVEVLLDSPIFELERFFKVEEGLRRRIARSRRTAYAPPERRFRSQLRADSHAETVESVESADIYPRRIVVAPETRIEAVAPDGLGSARPLPIEKEVGRLLYVHSPHIVRDIRLTAGAYPDLIEDGESLIIPEPFCVLWSFRERLLQTNRTDIPLTQNDAINSLPSTTVMDDIGSSAQPTHPADLSTATSHMSTLFGALDPLYLSSLLAERERGQSGSCTFEWVWLLFSPGTVVYETSAIGSPMMRAYKVSKFELQGLFSLFGNERPRVNPRRLESGSLDQPIERVDVSVESLWHDGRRWISKPELFTIYPFKGEKKITELSICPAYHVDKSDGKIRSNLIERGRRYRDLAARGQHHYRGDILSGVRRPFDGRIIVDSETYFHEPRLVGKRVRASHKPTAPPQHRGQFSDIQPNDSISQTGRKRRDSIHSDSGAVINGEITAHRDEDKPSELSSSLGSGRNVLDSTGLSEDDYITCAPVIDAYVLKERSWVSVAVGSIMECKYEEHMINDLQISDEARRLTLALSHNYKMRPEKRLGDTLQRSESFTPWNADFVPEKGGGQIILLHGKPGVGKTTTAECIAELTMRPLLVITCGDLGTDVLTVEREVTRWLRLGSLWHAVLLFDEADVFLEARAHGDFERNALVSVFLRALEYYQGLMFLTTNRIGSFDEAILSRIHVILHLPNLQNNDRAQIWDTSFRKLARERTNIHIDYTLMNYALHDEVVHKLNWNGREIRNAFNTMISLAEWDANKNQRYTPEGKIEVRRGHLEEVVKMSGTFKAYLKSLRMQENEQYVKSLGLRDDKFKGAEKV